MSFRKIDKEFCVTDDSVNVYGYRLLTEGLQLDRFKPAIGFLMHERKDGVAVKWSDFRVDGDKVFAKPSVNTNRFWGLFDEISEGFYGGASVGGIVALEISEDPDLKIEGQTGPTIKKWFPREISIVDIPGNYNAVSEEKTEDLKYDTSFSAFDGLQKLYDENDKLIFDLSNRKIEFNHSLNNKKMEKLTLSVQALLALGLAAGITPTTEQLEKGIADLSAQAQLVPDLQKQLKDLKAAQTTKEIAAIIEKGLADKKLTKELADKLTADYAANPAGLQALVDSMTAQTLVTEQLSVGRVPEKYAGKTFNELYVSGELAGLKADFPDYYETLKAKK